MGTDTSPVSDIHDGLRAWAAGYLPSAAAVEVILGTPLRDHLLRFVHHSRPGSLGHDGLEAATSLDWEAVERAVADGRVRLSGGEEVLYELVANLLEAREGFNLPDLCRLDPGNLAVVLTALATMR